MSRSQYAAVGLHGAKNPINVGSALRAAGCFGASLVAVSGRRYKRACTDTQSVYQATPLIQVDDLHSVVPYDCVPVAIDLVPGAVPLETYDHPARAFYVFGAEDQTLGASVLSWCRDRVAVSSGCLNLAAAVNVVLYDRSAKLARAERGAAIRVAFCDGCACEMSVGDGVDCELCGLCMCFDCAFDHDAECGHYDVGVSDGE